MQKGSSDHDSPESSRIRYSSIPCQEKCLDTFRSPRSGA
ncbi:hypothetical protein TNIN_382481, partial [Trichonephila inaurata madagascariensis]